VHGEELTGKRPLDLQPAEYGKLIHGHYLRGGDAPCADPASDPAQRRDVETSYARVILPLASDGEKVTAC